jgi:hypothetical protein
MRRVFIFHLNRSADRDDPWSQSKNHALKGTLLANFDFFFSFRGNEKSLQNFPRGLKPEIIFVHLAARLKSCPVTKHQNSCTAKVFRQHHKSVPITKTGFQVLIA